MLCFKEVIETNDFFFPFVTLKLLVTALCTIRNAMSFRTEEFSAYLCTQLIFSNIYTSIVCGVFSTRISYRGQFLLDEPIRRLFIAEPSPFRCNVIRFTKGFLSLSSI
jgi:hypothetical protein